MSVINVSRGLDLPISGAPEQSIDASLTPKKVALLGQDYIGLKPTMAVKETDFVKKGQLLFTDKKNPGVRYTSPVSGKVAKINRGEKRAFISLIIDVEGDEAIEFDMYTLEQLAELTTDQVKDQLVASGMWTSFRTRPFSKVPHVSQKPHAIFINAMDSNPLAVNPQIIIEEHKKQFEAGLWIVSKLTSGNVYLCSSANTVLSSPPSSIKNLKTQQFSGLHPAGLAGTHIHYLSPVSLERTVWHLNYQDLIAIGALFLAGRIFNQRIIALSGPQVKNPRLLKTIIGASIVDVCNDQLKPDTNRIVSGSVFGGHNAQKDTAYLGRYHLQVTAIEEGNKRDFMGWMSPGINRFSISGIYLSQFFKNKRFNFNTNTNGSPRAMVPIGAYEKIMPLDILPTQLLRSLIVGDIENAIKLGVLELDEEDLALCTFVCPGKYEYGPILRDMLTRIEKEVV
jgi:Na+-transporting NADH:ubiquinone oxidoreductase subunit A